MPTIASGIWPHLPRGTPEPVQGRREPASLAEAMYPRPQAPPATPRRRLTREEAFDWSGVDPTYARMVGLIPKGKR